MNSLAANTTENESEVVVRNTDARDFPGITDLCRRIYPDTPPWTSEQLSSHLRVFPEGQFVTVHGPDEKVVGMSASLIVDWEDYEMLDSWEQCTSQPDGVAQAIAHSRRLAAAGLLPLCRCHEA
jgi:hypothetical protein